MIKYDLGLTVLAMKINWRTKQYFFLVRIPGTRNALMLREALSKFTVRTNILCFVLIYDVFIVQNILTAPTKVKAELNIGKVCCVLLTRQILAISG
jgi:hypothetical protein